MPTNEEALQQLLDGIREQLQAQRDAFQQMMQASAERLDKLESELHSLQYNVKHLEQHSIEQHGLEAFHSCD